LRISGIWLTAASRLVRESSRPVGFSVNGAMRGASDCPGADTAGRLFKEIVGLRDGCAYSHWAYFELRPSPHPALEPSFVGTRDPQSPVCAIQPRPRRFS